MRKKCVMVIVSILLLSNLSKAQSQTKLTRDIESQRIAFITEQLNLSPQEAQQFWPVYNKYRQDLASLRSNRAVKLLEPNVNFDKYTDEQISKLMENELNYKQKELDLNREYNEEFKEVLPIKKVAQLYRAEQLFKVYIIKGNEPPARQNDPNSK
ncbi:MAG: hypothetical protein H0W62_12040 [Chitinophagales bacterium]|nr:hypothetical protein [Chitinophagales bacterium]